MNHERFIQLDPGTSRSPVPVNYVRNLVELIAEVGVDSRRLLSQVGLSEDEVYNPETSEKGKAEIIIGKHRNGATGTVRLAFQGTWLRFVNLAPESAYQYDHH